MSIGSVLTTDLTKSIYGKIIFGSILVLLLLAKFGLFRVFTPEGRCEMKFDSFISTQNSLYNQQGIKDSFVKLCLESGPMIAEEAVKSVEKSRK